MIDLKVSTNFTSLKLALNTRLRGVGDMLRQQSGLIAKEFTKEFKFIVGATRFDRSGKRVWRRTETGGFYDSIRVEEKITQFTSTYIVRISGERAQNIFKWLTKGTKPHWITTREDTGRLRIPVNTLRRPKGLGSAEFIFPEIVFHPGQKARDLVGMARDRSGLQKRLQGIRTKLGKL